jgi:hypothetical protein
MVDITAYRNEQLMENFGMQNNGIPERGAAPLFHDTFLSRRKAHVIGADILAKE